MINVQSNKARSLSDDLLQTEMNYWSDDVSIGINCLAYRASRNINFIKVKHNDMIQFIKLDNVVMILADSNYSMIHLDSGKQILTSKTLKYWMEKIGYQHPDFERVHRSFLINRKHILAYKPKDKTLILKGDRTVKVARNHKLIF